MYEQEINRFLKEIINTMNDAITIISPDGAILMVNRAMEEITGYSRDELIGSPCSIFHCDACEKARADAGGRWCQLFNLGHAHKKPCSILRKSGFYAPVLKNASLLKDMDGNVVAAVETFTDITGIRERDEKIRQLSRLLDGRSTFHGLIGQSAGMQRVFEIIAKAAQSEAPVIIFGETGTGKELVARAIHDLGSRRNGPYIQLNCAALNESLLESELFGHVKGAFTGAHTHRKGRFEAAHGGDIFLDEIGDIPLSMQVKLLRVLETKQFERVGDLRPINTDVRIITATNRDLDRLAAEGKFRQDLFFRINIIPIHLPPLRERLEDIPLLVEHFIRLLREGGGRQVSGPDARTMDLFMNYHWPGNVRELRGALEYAFVLAEKGAISPEHLPVRIKNSIRSRESAFQDTTAPLSNEKAALIDALVKCGGNQTRAARILGVNRVTVWHRMKKHGIDARDLPALRDQGIGPGRVG
ncbi:MAG: sigma 54-interacting transcriptional regulator [Deltaproteobacteria bacterium]|jgi:PAS domain S-box-containing protein|nr:sigma 54-interacting transcriptional regulator [Deltaproteobacteria bacterium]